MEIKFNCDLKSLLQSSRPVIIELGCGPRKTPGRIGIDLLDLPGVDIIADVNKGLGFLPNQSVDEIHSNSFFEHVDDIAFLIKEIVRVLKPTGKNYAFVPHFSNPYYYSDYTHTKFFGLYTFYYFVEKGGQLKRKVPNFYTGTRIQMHSIEYVFDSPFRGRKYFKLLMGKIFNSCQWTKELYEENFCYLIPCYGIRVVFGPAAGLES